MKVVFLQDLFEDTVAYFREELPEHELVFPQSDDEEVQAQAARDADILVGYRLPAAVAAAAPDLKAFITGAAGVHQSVGEQLRGRPGVQAANSHVNALDVAEHAVALALAAAKRITRGDRDLRRGDWSIRHDGLESAMVTGKRVVIIGYGAIGREVARMLRGFEVEVTGVRARTAEATPDDLGTSVITKETMAKALRGADYVFVAAPDTPATRGLVGKPELDLMKDTTVLVNISRGRVVEERALFEALKEGRLGAAGLDVWYVYPHSKEEIPRTFPGHHPFHELENVVLSPHRASFTPRLYREHWVDVVENIRRVGAGKQVTNPIDLESGY